MTESCDNLGPELAAYVSGNLTPDARRTLDAHLANCARCTRAERALSQVWSQLATLPEEPVPDVVLRGVKATVEAERTPVSPWHVTLETLLAMGLMALIAATCPVGGFCLLVQRQLTGLFGPGQYYLVHGGAAMMMGAIALAAAELVMFLASASTSLSRTQAVGALFVVVGAATMPNLGCCPPTPVVMASWAAGLVLAAFLGLGAARRIEPLLAIR